MNRSLSATCSIAVDAARRRRNVIVVSAISVLALGFAYALLGPKTYVAKSLLLLQESGRSNPLTRELPAFVRMQDRIAGLNALLKSERVLNHIISETSDGTPKNPKQIAARIRDLSASLSLELIGSDFLEFQLKGSSPIGLGKQLEAVTSQFIEALLPEQDVQSATQVILDKRKEELDVAERDYARLKERVGNWAPANGSSRAALLTEQRQKLQQKTKEAWAIGADLDILRLKFNEGNSITNDRVQQDIVKASAQISELEAGQPGLSPQLQTLKTKRSELQKLQKTEEHYQALQSEIDQLTKDVETVQRDAMIENELLTQSARVKKAQDAYDAYMKRHKITAGSRGPNILNAPERIKLIDAPRDPEFPVNSTLKIILASILASALVAVAIAAIVEAFDSTVRYADVLEELTGVPVLARLPPMPPDRATGLA